MTITRVLDERGEVLHDCIEAGCDVSWGGVALRDLEPDELYPDEKRRPADAKRVAKGERLPGASDPDPLLWTVKGNTARLKTNG